MWLVNTIRDTFHWDMEDQILYMLCANFQFLTPQFLKPQF